MFSYPNISSERCSTYFKLHLNYFSPQTNYRRQIQAISFIIQCYMSFNYTMLHVIIKVPKWFKSCTNMYRKKNPQKTVNHNEKDIHNIFNILDRYYISYKHLTNYCYVHCEHIVRNPTQPCENFNTFICSPIKYYIWYRKYLKCYL